jgi:hypothetical protein
MVPSWGRTACAGLRLSGFPVLTRDLGQGMTPSDSARLRDEVFNSSEKVFMAGLRSRDPKIRAKYFQLYHKSLPLSLYERLKFIVAVQEWDHVGTTFWLKHALVCPCSLTPDCICISLLPLHGHAMDLLSLLLTTTWV